MNGHHYEMASRPTEAPPSRPRSESELSDLNDLPPPRSAPQDAAASDDDAIHDMATSEMDEDEDAPGEEDADYDAESPPPEAGMRHDRSLSEESTRPGKRKSEEVDDDDFIKQNPELYGLRRSVGECLPRAHIHIADTAACRAEPDLHAEWYVHPVKVSSES